MHIRDRLARLAKLLVAVMFFSIIGAPQISHAAIPGKSQALPSWATGNDWVVVDSIGIKKQTPTAVINTPIIFVPSYVLGTNAGTIGLVNTANYYATLAYTIKDPNGNIIQNSPIKQDIEATGVLNRLADKRVVQATTTNGARVMVFPDKIGTYTVTMWHDFNENLILDNNETNVSTSFVVYDSTKLALTVNNFGSNVIGKMTDGSYGFLSKICVSNYSTPAGMYFTSGILVTTNSATEIFDSISKWNNGNFEMVDVGNPTAFTLTADNFGENGCAYINHYNSISAPGLVTMVVTWLSGELKDVAYSTSFLYFSEAIYPESNGSARVVTNSSNLVTTYSSSSTATAPAAGPGVTNFEIGIPVSSTTAINISTTATPVDPGNKGSSVLMRVVDTDGTITGLKGASYMVSALIGSSGAPPYTVTPNTFYGILARNQSFMIYVQGNQSILGGNTAGTVAIQVKPIDRFPKYMTGSPTTLRANVGETINTYLQVRDQFGLLMPNAVIIPIVNGRNSNQNNLRAFQADSYGRISWNFKDESSTSDIFADKVTAIDATGQTLLGDGLTIYYGPLPKISKISVTGAATENKPGEYTKSYIDTSYSGASNTTVLMTATLYDANGGTLPAGVKVSWSTKGLDSKTAIPTDTTSGIDYHTSYTDSSGQAITYVYSYGVGDVEVYATYDGVTSAIPGKIHFANAPTDARVVSATSTEGWIKAHVEDRYGNPVQGVDLTFSRISGKGYMPGNSFIRVSALTDRDGNIEIAVVGGDATFEIATTTDYFGQTSSEAGFVNGALVSTSSAGGTLTPAGVGKVKIDVKSRDFQAETLAAAETAMNAAFKSIEAADKSADKADAALASALKVQEKLAALSASITQSSLDIKKTLTSLFKTIQKIQKRIG